MSKISVLIVDDEPEHRDYVTTLLKAMNPDGFTFEYAEDVGSAKKGV